MVSSRRVSVHLDAETASYKRKLAEAGAATSAFGRQVDGSGKEVDKLSGRLRIATDAALVLGPALAPLGAGAVAGLVALSAQLGAVAGGLGVTLLAVNGLGDGLKALDAYQLEPTAANLEKLNQQMDKLGPSGEHFVRFLDSLEPDLRSLQMAARDGLLPGAEEGISHLLTMLPQLRAIVSGIATELGDLSADAGKALAGERFRDFFNYLQTDAAPILDATSRTVGNLAEAVANLFVGFGPLTGDFSGGLLKFSEGLAEASRNLDQNQGFQDFLSYIESTGPQALATLEALANAVLQIVEATAPLGGPVLMALEGVAKAIAAIADSDLGTPLFAGLAALALYDRSMKMLAGTGKTAFGQILLGQRKVTAGFAPAGAAAKTFATDLVTVGRFGRLATEESARLSGQMKTLGRGTAILSGLAIASTGVADSFGLSNTASLALMGTIAGPWGAAVGAGVGLAMDLAHANDDLEAAVTRANLAMSATPDEQKAAADALRKEIEETDAAVGRSSGLTGHDGIAGQIKDTWTALGAFIHGGTDEAKTALSELERTADGTAFTIAGLSNMFRNNADAAQKEADAITASVDAMRAKRQEALRAVNAELNYQAAIDDARKALKENGATADKTTEKGRANRAALYQLADAWNQQSNAAKNAKGSLEQARKNFLQTAADMKVPEGEAKRLANALFEIPPKRKTQISVDTGTSLSLIAKVRQELASLHDKTVHVTTVGTTVKAAGGALTHADGGTVVGPRQPYGDKMLYLLAPGEEVVSNRYGQADRHRALLKKINASRAADGATAGGDGDGRRHGNGLGSGIFSVDAAANSATNGLKALKEALDRAKASVDREKQSRDDLIQQKADFASQVGGAYSTMDPFAQASGSVWAQSSNPLAMFDAAVAGNTANTQAAQAALGTAAGKGLDGALYQALAGSGNLQLLQAFADLSAAEIDAREKAFATQSAAQASLGGQAAGVVFDKRLAESNKHLQKIEDRIHVLTQAVHAAAKETGDRVGDKVNGAAASGHRRGQR